MKEIYQRGTSQKIVPREKFINRLRIVTGVIVVLFIGLGLLAYDLYSSNSNVAEPISKTTIKSISFEDNVISTPYFRFTDSGNWKLAADDTGAGKFVFRKYLGKSEVVQHQVFVYVNKTPIPNDLASPKALPVEIKNSNSFRAGAVIKPCKQFYGEGELYKVKLKKLDETTILCDPGSTQYRVVLAQKGGDYNLKLTRQNGQVANYIIVYQDQEIEPSDMTLLNIANSFQAL